MQGTAITTARLPCISRPACTGTTAAGTRGPACTGTQEGYTIVHRSIAHRCRAIETNTDAITARTSATTGGTIVGMSDLNVETSDPTGEIIDARTVTTGEIIDATTDLTAGTTVLSVGTSVATIDATTGRTIEIATLTNPIGTVAMTTPGVRRPGANTGAATTRGTVCVEST